MREDMAKIIVERPRTGGGSKTPKGSIGRSQCIPLDELPSKQGMRRAWSGNRKMLNENLAPLRRFIESKVGQPWNDVNSEIRQRVNLNSAVQLHIWQHVMDSVCIHANVRDGKIIHFGNPWRSYQYYVDPSTGVLCENPGYRSRWRQPEPKAPDYIRIDQWSQYRKLNGIWFLVRLAPLPENPALAWDVVLRSHCTYIPASKLAEFYGCGGYAVSKRQLNTREIRKLIGHAGRKTGWQPASVACGRVTRAP